MSGQIPLYLPNLLTQPFSQIPHRILPNLNLNVWLLEPQLSMSEVSLRQWQHELKLLRESQPNQSMRLSGPFLQSGASVIRWTSGQRLLTSCRICSRTGSCGQVQLMATGQPLQTNWEIHPSIVAKMRISLVSWLVSTETDLRVGEASPPGTFISYCI